MCLESCSCLRIASASDLTNSSCLIQFSSFSSLIEFCSSFSVIYLSYYLALLFIIIILCKFEFNSGTYYLVYNYLVNFYFVEKIC